MKGDHIDQIVSNCSILRRFINIYAKSCYFGTPANSLQYWFRGDLFDETISTIVFDGNCGFLIWWKCFSPMKTFSQTVEYQIIDHLLIYCTYLSSLFSVASQSLISSLYSILRYFLPLVCSPLFNNDVYFSLSVIISIYLTHSNTHFLSLFSCIGNKTYDEPRIVMIQNLFPHHISLYFDDSEAGSFLTIIKPEEKVRISVSSGA